MAIGRQSTKAGIASGNFGRAGTQLASTGSNGPDVGRLLKTLGIAAQETVQTRQRENVDAASAAIRETIIRTKRRPEGMTKEDHMVYQQSELEKVRTEFSDQGLFVEAFTNENPAVKAMDSIAGRARALQAKNTMRQVMSNTAGQPLDVQQNSVFEALRQENDLTRGLSEGAHASFLEGIQNEAINIDDAILSRHAERIKQMNLAEVKDTNYKELDDRMAQIANVYSPEMNSDIDFFSSGRENLKNNFDDAKDAVSKHAMDVYEKSVILSGDREAAGAQAVDLVVQAADRYNMPELLDTLETMSGGNKKPLASFHRAQIDKARAQIEAGVVRKEQSLRARSASMAEAKNTSQYTQVVSATSEAVSTALMNPGDPVTVGIARDVLDQQFTAFNKDKAAGLYVGNEDQALRINKALVTYQLSLNSSFGDARAESLIYKHIGNKTLTQDIYNTYADRMGSQLKRISLSIIQPQINKARELQSELMVVDRHLKEKEVYRPFDDFKDTTVSNESSYLDQLTIENIKKTPNGSIPTVNYASMKEEYEEAKDRLTRQLINDEKRAPTTEEIYKATQPVIDKYQKIDDSRKQLIREYAPALRKQLEDAEVQRKAAVVKKIPSVDKFLEAPSMGGIRADEKELEEIYRVLDSGEADILGADKDRILYNALSTEILNKKQNVADAMTTILNRTTFDPNNPAAREELAGVLTKSLTRYQPKVDNTKPEDKKDVSLKSLLKGSGGIPLVSAQGSGGVYDFISNLVGSVRASPERVAGFYNLVDDLKQLNPGQNLLFGSFKDDIGTSIRSGDFFTEKGIAKLKEKYPQEETWGDIDSILNKIKE